MNSTIDYEKIKFFKKVYKDNYFRNTPGYIARTAMSPQMKNDYYHMMKWESNRYYTFVNEETNNLNPKILAKAGFFYIDKNIIQCPFCKVTFNNLTANQDAMNVHKDASPECIFIIASDSVNFPCNDDFSTKISYDVVD